MLFFFFLFFFFGVEKGGERGEGGGSLRDHEIDIALLKLINFFEDSNIVMTLALTSGHLQDGIGKARPGITRYMLGPMRGDWRD